MLTATGATSLFFGTQDGRIHALRGNGKPLWVVELPKDLGGRVDWVIAADVLGTGKAKLVANANGPWHIYVLK